MKSCSGVEHDHEARNTWLLDALQAVALVACSGKERTRMTNAVLRESRWHKHEASASEDGSSTSNGFDDLRGEEEAEVNDRLSCIRPVIAAHEAEAHRGQSYEITHEQKLGRNVAAHAAQS